MTLFQEIKNGYGFEEVEQKSDGLHCDGCLTVHKKPVKIYSDGKQVLCKFQLIYFYRDAFQSN